MKRLSYLAVGIVLGAFAVSAAGRVTTQDPVKVSPQYYEVRFENDRVRVLEFHLKPGEKEAMHSHPPGVVYLLADATIRNVLPDGTSSEASRKAGDVLWREDTTHTAENVGATEARAIAIELKPCTR
ncbi:MAG: cytoplasmic protein [Actinomycetota bacterium]|nr:cytoplasmic protein [Actinomycetota bacterium]